MRLKIPTKNLNLYDWQSIPHTPIIGVDEVGRGCLAGPVYASAVVINPQKNYSHYTDSKALSAKQREILCKDIQAHHEFCTAFASVDEIANINILQASLLAMKRAILALGYTSGHILVDGKQEIPDLPGFEQTNLIKGDLRAAPIAAASIVAKVTRDQLMVEAAKEFPEYGFEKHKGYGTQLHKKAIAQFGPCHFHRSSFAGVKEFLWAKRDTYKEAYTVSN